MRKFISSARRVVASAASALGFFIGSAAIALAATTIGTNISTDGTLTVTGDAAFDTNTLFVDVSADSVGIGTTTPDHLLELTGGGIQMNSLTHGIAFAGESPLDEAAVTDGFRMYFDGDLFGVNGDAMVFEKTDFNDVTDPDGGIVFANRASDNSRDVSLSILGGGDVGVGTITPESRLHVHKATAGTVTADANALLTLENSTTAYLNFLTPGASDAGILFGHGGGTAVDGAILYNHDGNTDGLTFNTDAGDRMFIDSSGDVGIGVSPTYRLDVTDDIANTGVVNVYNSNVTDPDGIRIKLNKSDVASSDAFIFFVDGDDATQGQITGSTSAEEVQYLTSSDARLKDDITNASVGLADLMELRPREYRFLGSDAVRTGFIAQEVYEVYPDAVHVGGNDPVAEPWMVDYGKLTPLIVKAVQDQQGEIDALKAENAALTDALCSVAPTLDICK